MIGERTTLVVPFSAMRRNNGGPHEDIISVVLSLAGEHRTLIVAGYTEPPEFVDAWLRSAGFRLDRVQRDPTSPYDVAMRWLSAGRGAVLYFGTDPVECSRLARYGAGTLCAKFSAWEPDHVPETVRPWTDIAEGMDHEDHLRRSRESVEP